MGVICSTFFTPVTDRGVISTGPTPSSGPVPGIQVEGWFADDPTNQARFVLRFPDDWNGKLVVAGASGTRSEYNGDWGWSDYVLPKGYAYASQNKGVLNLCLAALSPVPPPTDPLACRLNPTSVVWVHFYDNDPGQARRFRHDINSVEKDVGGLEERLPISERVGIRLPLRH